MTAGAKKKTRVVARSSRAAKPVAGPDLPAGREGYKLDLAPTHKPVRVYYDELAKFERLGARHEGAVRDAFGTLLKHCAGQVGWTLVGEHPHVRRGRNPAKIDGALLDKWGLVRVHWEAKDSDDDLDKEVKKKLADDYPTDNIVFQAPERAILYQNGHRVYAADLRNPTALVDLIIALFRYRAPPIDEWEKAADEFGIKVPELSAALVEIIEQERKTNRAFVQAFTNFCEMCRTAINPNIGEDAVERMLVQHLLTERIFRKVFDNADFASRNVIAVEIEKVIRALTSRAFNRDRFLANLDRFYRTLETAAATIDDYAQKQSFLNRVYERFFQGFDEKAADTHGIVYTPQPIVQFMTRSVDELLKKEFGRGLGDTGVHIIDPFVGTGNFILNVMRNIPKTRLAAKYEHEIHANEIMLLPYYVAAMNIEHEYQELTGKYAAFEGLCLVDTFELAESRQQQQLAFMSPANSQRVERQKRSPIFVILGNPPYNAWQMNENDRNKNRKYDVIDGRVKDTYGADSNAQLVNSLRDPYVKAYRWATDRLGEEGVLAFVTNGSFLSKAAFDGMRRNLEKEYDEIYLLDLGGDVRSNPKISGTTHNVFGDRVGIAVAFLVRRKAVSASQRCAKIFYAKTDEDWRKEQKLKFLDDTSSLSSIDWKRIEPDAKATWLREGLRADFESMIPLVAAHDGREPKAIFTLCSNGLKSNNDAYVYDFDGGRLEARARRMVDAYTDELQRWQSSRSSKSVDDFIRVDERVLKWIFDTKQFLSRGTAARFEASNVRPALYRPFTAMHHFFDRVFNNRLYQLRHMFPPDEANVAIVVSDAGHRSDFSVLAVDRMPEQHLCASTDAVQTMSLWIFDEDGGNKRSNVTDWALKSFQDNYRDGSIKKEDVFYYVYGILHHPEYRERYKANLRRDLPRVPFAPDFRAFATAGRALAEVHLNYESQPEWPLERKESPDAKLDWRVERMKLSRDRRSIVYNDFLTLVGLPPEAFDYRLGGRTALEWIIDQYRVTTDKRSGITSDPNRRDDPEYVVRLIGKIAHVSVETTRIVRALPQISASETRKKSASR